MKKITFALLALLFLIVSITYSQEVHYVRQVNLSWDEVTTYESGAPIGTDEYVSYMVYLRDDATQERFTIENLTSTEITFTFIKGMYVAGVSSIIHLPDGTSHENPDVTWSTSTDIVRVPQGPFYVRFGEYSAAVEGLIYNSVE